VDVKQFKLPDWLIVGGGAVVFLFGFFDWFDTGSASSSAFKFTLTGVIPWLLIVSSAVMTYQIRTGLLTVRKWPWPTIFLFATTIGAILILVRVIIGCKLSDFGDLPEGIENQRFDRKFTLWLSLLGGIAAAVGSGLSFVAAGGTANDLPFVARFRAGQQKAAAKKASTGGSSSSSGSSSSESGRNSGARRLPPAEQDRPFDVDDDTGF
jgi:hypothetical protein